MYNINNKLISYLNKFVSHYYLKAELKPSKYKNFKINLNNAILQIISVGTNGCN